VPTAHSETQITTSPKRNSVAKHGLHNRQYSSDTDDLDVQKGTYYKSSVMKIIDFKLSQRFSTDV